MTKNTTITFESLQLIQPIQKALSSEGYTHPTPIQAQAIPLILDKRDLFGIAQTGTGKTAAFTIPILQMLASHTHAEKGKKPIKCLILTPTRELASQIGESIANYGKHLKSNHTVIFGGVNQFSQVNAIRAGVEILIATPGRLLDLINQRIVSLKEVQYLVLDEADRMLDMGFINDVKKIIATLPQKRQTLLFSATMPADILKLASTILYKPATVEVTPTSSTVEKIQQTLYYVEKNDKKKLLNHILKDKEIQSALVFSRTKHGADKIVKELIKANITAQAIHGDKSQNAREAALRNFKSGQTRVLVATDIAARGIDIDKLSHVINYDIPNIPETYVHRIGRTGRAGESGKAYSFCETEEIPNLMDILKLIKIEIPVVTDHPYAMTVVAYTKPKADSKKAKLAGGNKFGGIRNGGNKSAGKSSGAGKKNEDGNMSGKRKFKR
jgi:ATP-dependent RNA helicase RhlE